MVAASAPVLGRARCLPCDQSAQAVPGGRTSPTHGAISPGNVRTGLQAQGRQRKRWVPKPFGCEPEMHAALDPLSFANNRSITIIRGNLQKPISCEFFSVCRVGFSMPRLAKLVCRCVL
jgi:hypothetical protein